MQLLWGKGIESLSGVRPRRTRRLPIASGIRSRRHFSCDRENEKADCIPILPFDLHFSSSVAREYAEKIVMKGPNNTVFKPMLSRSEEEGEDPSQRSPNS